jgi:hypothetical protein
MQNNEHATSGDTIIQKHFGEGGVKLTHTDLRGNLPIFKIEKDWTHKQ